jgi:hypothetical protein
MFSLFATQVGIYVFVTYAKMCCHYVISTLTVNLEDTNLFVYHIVTYAMLALSKVYTSGFLLRFPHCVAISYYLP